MNRVSAVLILMTVLMAGCGSSAIRQKQTFIPDVKPPVAAQKLQSDVVLEVNRFTIDTAFKSKGLTFRRTDARYVSSYYIELMQTPGDLFTEQSRQWLSKSGLFALVLDPGSTIRPTHILEGHILDYYIDTRTSQPAAVMTIKAILIKQGDDAASMPILKGTYKAAEPVKSVSGEDVMAGLARCTEKVLSQLQADMARAAW